MSSPSPRPQAIYDADEMAEAVDLDQDKKRRIVDLFANLDELSYYALLGVPAGADKKQIKAAYYGLAPEFHPDRYFRKNLGSFKAKIEAVFSRITLAHDVLSSKQRRAEYDTYLDQSTVNRSIAQALAHAEVEARAVEQAIEQSARANVPEPSPAPPRAALSAEDRRAILARKLMGPGLGRVPSRPAGQAPPPPSIPPPPADAQAAQQAAAQTLKARYEAAKSESMRAQIATYRRAAEEAIGQNEFAKASSAYRIAAHLAPDDVELQRRCEEVQKLAAAALAAGYLKQAAYEENEGRWADASLSYTRATEGRPDDAFAYERAAFATIKAGGSARRAVEYARRAVELMPQSPENHITLARTYIAAGFAVSAIGELDRALGSGPLDAQHKQIVAELRDQAHRLSKLG